MYSSWYSVDHFFWSFETNTDYPPNQYIFILYLPQTMAVAKGNPVFWMLSKNFCFLILILVIKLFFIIFFSPVQLFSHVRLFATPWTTVCQASLSITNSRNLTKLMSVESVMPFNHLNPFSCLQSFPLSGSFQMSHLFPLGDQRTGVSPSTSVLPMNTQDWSPLGWTGWISLQSKGPSSVFSSTTVQKHQFFGVQLYL